jgi:hypothetical protein
VFKEKSSMRSILSVLAVAALAVAGSAHAAPAPFQATLTVQVGTFDPIPFTGSGNADTVPDGAVTIPAGELSAGFVSRLTAPLLGIIPGFAVCAPGYPDGTTFPIPATGGDVVFDCTPLDNGELDTLTFDGNTSATGGLIAAAYLAGQTNQSAVGIPLNIIGVGGQATFNVLGTASTLDANPWTTEEVVVAGGLASTTPFANPFCNAAGDPYSCCTGAGMGRCDQFIDSGFDNRDPATGLGQVKLVTTALATLGALGTVPTLATLSITLPEPTSATAGLAAMGALALLARRARRS